MRTLIWFLASICAFAFLTSSPCHSMERAKEGIAYPEGDIKEIRIYGAYEPEDPQRLENFKEMLIRRHHLKPGETLQKKYPQFLDIGDEKFRKYPQFNYCYDKTPDGKKKPVINKNLRVRLYDMDEYVIAEDYLRVQKFDEQDNHYFTVSYVPYEKVGNFFRVVRLEGKKEVILWKPRIRGSGILSKAQLIHLSELTPHPFRLSWFKYRPETKCHHSRFKIR